MNKNLESISEEKLNVYAEQFFFEGILKITMPYVCFQDQKFHYLITSFTEEGEPDFRHYMIKKGKLYIIAQQ